MATKVTLALAILFLNPLGSLAHLEPLHLKRSPHDRVLLARQSLLASSAVASGSSSTSYGPAAASATSVGSASASGYSVGSAAAAASATLAPPAVSGSGSTSSPPSTLTATNPAIPPLMDITSGMPSQASATISFTFAAGASPPVSGAPPLPTTTLDRSKYPAPTQIAPTDTPLVAQWLKELDGVSIPDIPPTTDQALCSSNAQAASDTTRCWWTCGGCTRDTDIVTCPNKWDWGLTFDDGPSPYTPTVLNYLNQQHTQATFFVVGSSAYWNPSTLQAEYLAGHQIGVHTWFHQHLTTLSNEEIVAELGYTREIIKDIIGVTPTILRPPYGDIDDRVRAIAMGMGLQPSVWTRDPVTKEQYDTNDWKIPSGIVTGPDAYAQFQTILTNASQLNTGFIVLEHDLYAATVDLAVGYTLPSAMSHQPAFNLKSINQCLGLPSSEVYQETQSNKTRMVPSTTWGGPFLKGLSSSTNSSSSSSNSSSGGSSSSANGTPGSASASHASHLSAGVLVAGMVALLTTFLA